MKTLLITIITGIVGLTAFPTTVEASPRHNQHQTHTYRSGASSCGCPVYTKKVFAGYDCYHRPTYRYYRVPVVHKCRHTAKPTRHYYSNNHYRNNYYSQRSRGYNSRISFNTGYGRVSICR